MMTVVARAVVRLAARCLGGRRREWGLAMQSEFEVVAEGGPPMRFALGCLMAAWREMPAHEEGRFVLASYVLALGLIVPAAALMLSGILAGTPGPHFDLAIGRGGEPLLTEANLSAVPALAILALLLAAAHLIIAWTMLRCEWGRVATVARLTAAMTVTLAIFSGLVFVSNAGLVHAAVAALELTGVLILAHWHSELPGEPPQIARGP